LNSTISVNHLSGLTDLANLPQMNLSVNPEDQIASPKAPNTFNRQFFTQVILNIPPKAEYFPQTEIRSIEPRLPELYLKQLAEDLRSIVNPHSKALLNLLLP
jgi:hypothetical protein